MEEGSGKMKTKKMMLVVVMAGMVGMIGCGHKKDSAKTTSESSEFFKEIGTVEQENAQAPSNTEMQNAMGAVPAEPSAESSADGTEKPSGRDIQQALQNASLYQGKLDGVLGPKTKKAVEAFQSQNNLKADGKVGPKTWQKLKAYLNASTPAANETPAQQASSTHPSNGISD